MKWRNLQPRMLSLARILFRFDQEIQSFTDKGTTAPYNTTARQIREFSIKPALQEMLKGLLLSQKKWPQPETCRLQGKSSLVGQIQGKGGKSTMYKASLEDETAKGVKSSVSTILSLGIQKQEI